MVRDMSDLRLALGPILYFWSRESVLEFYQQVADAPVDIVYLGETICAKRRQIKSAEWLDIARALAARGKQVVLSTLNLIEADSELRSLERICAQSEFPVEANDLAAVQARAGQPFVGGPSLNLYNAMSVAKLAQLGMRRWVMPVELSRDAFEQIVQDLPAGVEAELFAFGRLPLAYSARCFTARAHNLPKDDCQFRCMDYPAGMLLTTREDQPFLCLNGIQTQSAQTYNLIAEMPQLAALGAQVLRISPQPRNTLDIVCAFDAVRKGELTPDAAAGRLQPYLTGGACDGYWYGRAGIEVVNPSQPSPQHFSRQP